MAHDGLLPPIPVTTDAAPTVQLEVLPDPVSGWNARVTTDGFTFAPEHFGNLPQDGEGHAYLFVNGKRAARIYGEWFHLGQLPAGVHEVAVTLNANNTANLATEDALIMDRVDVMVPQDGAAPNTGAAVPGHVHTFDLNTGGGTLDALNTVEFDGIAPSVDVQIKRDGVSGWNVQVITENFEFAPENAGSDYITGQGHAHLYVDGQKITRLVDDWYHLDGFDAAGHEITVVLNSNDHRALTVDGQLVTASATTIGMSQPDSFNMALMSNVTLDQLVPPSAPPARFMPELNAAPTYAARDGKAVNRNGAMVAEGADIWGWTDPMTNAEIAIIALTTGTSFVDITDPFNPELLGFLPTQTNASFWRDVKTYSNHAFIVADSAGSHGMQVFDLTRLRDVTTPQTFAADTVYTGVNSMHNLAINEDTGYAYLVGESSSNMSLHIVDISTPASPQFVTEWENKYTHDTQVVVYNGPDADYQGREIAINSDENQITIVDVTDKQNIAIISSVGYANSRYTHQGWFTEDQRYFLSNDELDETGLNQNTRTFMWDFSDLDNPTLINFYEHPTTSIDHNLYTHNGLVYMANYTSGLRVFELDDIANGNLTATAYYDTYPINDGATFNGAWSVYPYFESGNLIVSDIDGGLFVLTIANVASLPVNLAVTGIDEAPVVPTFTFKHQTDIQQTEAPADSYRIFVRDDATDMVVIDETFPANEICTGVDCTITPAELNDWGLLNGAYIWRVAAITGDVEEFVRVPARFTVALPAPPNAANIDSRPNQGRPTIEWTADANAFWYQVYAGNASRTYLEWHPASDLCEAGMCSINPEIDWPSGTYDVWVQVWGPGGFAETLDGWAQGTSFTLPSTPAGLPGVLTAADDSAAQPTIQWTSGDNATWYQLVVTTDNFDVLYNQWHQAGSIGCAAAAATCAITELDLGNLSNGATYRLYAQAWGPGGFSTGGLEAAPSWNEGSFVYSGS